MGIEPSYTYLSTDAGTSLAAGSLLAADEEPRRICLVALISRASTHMLPRYPGLASRANVTLGSSSCL